PEVELLLPSDARNLRLPWLSRFDSSLLAVQLQEYPNMSLWAPRTGEYIIGEQWRRREDIANILEVTARKGKPTLVRSLLEHLASLGYRLVMLSDEARRDSPTFYTDLGFEQLEKIVFFEKELKSDELVQLTALLPGELPVLEY